MESYLDSEEAIAKAPTVTNSLAGYRPAAPQQPPQAHLRHSLQKYFVQEETRDEEQHVLRRNLNTYITEAATEAKASSLREELDGLRDHNRSVSAPVQQHRLRRSLHDFLQRTDEPAVEATEAKLRGSLQNFLHRETHSADLVTDMLGLARFRSGAA